MRILLQLPRGLTEKRGRLGIAGLILGIILLLVFWWILNERQPASFTGKNSLPVNAPLESQAIQFATETVKSEPQGENYFVDYRLQREQSRQEEKAMLAALLNSNVEKTKEEAQKKWLELSSKIGKEDQIENLLKIKGFKDVIADVTLDSVNIVIYAQALSPNELSLIQDTIIRILPVHLDRINISVKK